MGWDESLVRPTLASLGHFRFYYHRSILKHIISERERKRLSVCHLRYPEIWYWGGRRMSELCCNAIAFFSSCSGKHINNIPPSLLAFFRTVNSSVEFLLTKICKDKQPEKDSRSGKHLSEQISSLKVRLSKRKLSGWNATYVKLNGGYVHLF